MVFSSRVFLSSIRLGLRSDCELESACKDRLAITFNAQKFTESRDPGPAPVLKKNSRGHGGTGLSPGACLPNLKFVSLVILELLAFNAQNLRGNVTLTTPPFRQKFSEVTKL